MRTERIFGVQGCGHGEAAGPLARRMPGAGRRARARCRGPAPPPAARRGGSSHACCRQVSEGIERGLVAAKPKNWTNSRAPPLASGAGATPPSPRANQLPAGGRGAMTHIRARRGAPRGTYPSRAPLASLYSLLGLSRSAPGALCGAIQAIAVRVPAHQPHRASGCAPPSRHLVEYTPEEFAMAFTRAHVNGGSQPLGVWSL